MADAVTGLDAGRQTPAHEKLSQALWFRKIGDVYRFLLDPQADPCLSLERVGQKGGTLLTRVAEAGAAGRDIDTGLVLVDGRDGLAFCTRAEPLAFLRRLATLARQGVHQTPALALLVDAGAGPLTVDPANDEAARAYVPEGAQVVYDATLWDDLLEPDVATTAAALAAAAPGERLWYWLAEDEKEGVVPLIMQPVAWDPNHDRTNWLVDRNGDRGADAGVTGTATMRDDGVIQLLGGGQYRYMLEQLARWVTANHEQYPALRRLVDCQLLNSSGGAVGEIIVDPTLWADLPHEAPPATVRAAAAALDALPEGGECWFWLTGGPDVAPFLHLTPLVDDPDGLAFQAALPRLHARFAGSHTDAITGVLSRPSPNRLLCSSPDVGAQRFPVQVDALLRRYGATLPALGALANATLVYPGDDGQPQAVAAQTPRS